MNRYFEVTVLTKAGGTRHKRVWAPSAKVARLTVERYTMKKQDDRVLSVTPYPSA